MLPLQCNLRHSRHWSELCCLSVSLKSYYGCWGSLQWKRIWACPSLPTHWVPGNSRRVFLAWLHARGDLCAKQPGRAPRAAETDGSGLTWSNRSHRVFSVFVMWVFACQLFHVVHCFSMWGVVPKSPKYKAKLQGFQSQNLVSLLRYCSVTDWSQGWGLTPPSTIPVHVLGNLTCPMGASRTQWEVKVLLWKFRCIL